MEGIWFEAAIWFALAVISTFVASLWRISVALTDIVIGAIVGLLLLKLGIGEALNPNAPWLLFLAGAGSIALTFLAGAELEPEALKEFRVPAFLLGLLGFLFPFVLVALIAHFVLGWDWRSSWLGGIALSTTSVAVVYAVMLEFGFNRTSYGKLILAACFINDLGTVIALGLIFAPFTWKTGVFVAFSGVSLVLLWLVVPHLLQRYGNLPSELEAKFLFFVLFLLGGLAVWSGSEPVLPAYVIGMILAGSVGRDLGLVRRLRTVTVGFLVPVYFLRAGLLVSLPHVAQGFVAFSTLFLAKIVSKWIGIYPAAKRFNSQGPEAVYLTLLMSTGLTFGTISALYGLRHGIITKEQYSLLVAAVIASAVIPTWVANRFFLPVHHLPRDPRAEEAKILATEDE
jgi:Kef-type K+ transport system membrane component KefB